MTDPTPAAVESPPERLLTWSSGGWVLALTAVFTLTVLAVVLIQVARSEAGRPPGDGKDPATFGFALEPVVVPVETLVAGQRHRDLMPSLGRPAVIPGASIVERNTQQRGKILVTSDRVIGVTVGGVARAYPVSMMRFHEVANDELGGRPIVVAYNPLCDSVDVFDRSTAGGTPREFGTSGLLWNSGMLLYDRTEPEPQSLWCPRLGQAITGPAATRGDELVRISAELTHWSDWLERHPDTTVLDPDPVLKDLYKNTNYAGYYRSDELMWPVEPLPDPAVMPWKTRCLIVRTASGAERVYPFASIAMRAGDDDRWDDVLDGVPLTLRVWRDPAALTVRVRDGGDPNAITTMHAFWFAWHAAHPGADVVLPPEAEASAP